MAARPKKDQKPEAPRTAPGPTFEDLDRIKLAVEESLAEKLHRLTTTVAELEAKIAKIAERFPGGINLQARPALSRAEAVALYGRDSALKLRAIAPFPARGIKVNDVLEVRARFASREELAALIGDGLKVVPAT
jgi:hypothetical protein